MFTGRVAGDYVRAMRAGFFSQPFGHEGGITGHPADFLVDGNGIVRFARYGSDYADTMTVDEALRVARERGLSTPRLPRNVAVAS
jgi:hypothetical protein